MNTLVRLCIPLVSIAVGFALGIEYSQNSVVSAAEPKQVQNPEVEEIAPIMKVGSAGIGTLLAGRIATDALMVQGLDLIKLHEETLGLLKQKGIATASELNRLVKRSRPEKVLKMKPSTPKK